MTQLRLSIPSWFSRVACCRELFHKKSKKSSKNRSRFWVSSRLAVMANLTLRGLLFKTEMGRWNILVKVSVDSSPRAGSISDSVKLTKIPDTQTDGRTETSRQEHHSGRNKRFAQKCFPNSKSKHTVSIPVGSKILFRLLRDRENAAEGGVFF